MRNKHLTLHQTTYISCISNEKCRRVAISMHNAQKHTTAPSIEDTPNYKVTVDVSNLLIVCMTLKDPPDMTTSPDQRIFHSC